MMRVLHSDYARALGADADDASARRELALPFAPHLSGRTGFLHGGAIAGFLVLIADDAANGQGRCFSSSVQFLRGARESELRGTAMVAQGTRIMTVTAHAWQDDEQRPVATICRKYRVATDRP